jgi:hypothetical protein
MLRGLIHSDGWRIIATERKDPSKSHRDRGLPKGFSRPVGRVHRPEALIAAAVTLSPDQWEAIEETLEILQDSEAMAALRQSDDDVREGPAVLAE